MSGLLGAGLQMPLNLSLGYKNLPLIGTGTLATSLDLVSAWDQYVKKPNIPQNFNLNTPSTSYSPAFAKVVSDKGSAPLISGLQVDVLKVAGYLVPAAAAVDKAVAINLGTDLRVTRTDNLAFSELDGTVTINGTQVPFAIGTSGSTTAYVNIPSTAGSSVSVVVGNFKLKNDFYTQFGLAAKPYVEVDGKVPFWGTVQVYRQDFLPISVSIGSTAHSSLGISSASTITGAIKVTQMATQENVDMLARIIMSEASIGNDAERTAVGWTVRNRMARNSTTKVADVAGAYAHNQTPTQQIRDLALSILQSNGPDPTNGATHFYSPISMPKEGDNTTGWDVGGGLEWTDGLSKRNYRPSWALTYEPRSVFGVRPAYYKFYKAPGNGPVR